MLHPDFPASVPAGDVIRALSEHGCALVRGTLDHDQAIGYREALSSVYRKHSDRPDLFPPEVARGDVVPSVFKAASGLAMDDLFSISLLGDIARGVLGAYCPAQSTFLTTAPRGDHAIRGLQLHTDGIIQGTEQLVVSMWAPLHACGVEAPGLSVVKAPKEAVLDYLRQMFPGKRLPGWRSDTEWDSTEAFRRNVVESRFGPIWSPEMAPGDVLLFTNWTIHGSNVTPEMTRARSAAIYRLRGKTLKERIRDHELQLFGRRRSLKAWISGHVP